MTSSDSSRVSQRTGGYEQPQDVHGGVVTARPGLCFGAAISSMM